VINRRKFIAEKEAEKLHGTADGGAPTKDGEKSKDKKKKKKEEEDSDDEESVPLNKQVKGGYDSISKSSSSAKFDESVDFFPLIIEEINKINNFFVGKLAEIHASLDDIVNERQNTYRSHHTSSDTSYLTKLRDIYVELAALRSYCELNKTGFSKIIKKYDKVMEEKNLESWMRTIDRQTFTTSQEPLKMMDIVTGLVSRDKLIEWERFATEQQNKVNEEIFVSVRWSGLLLSLSVFILTLSMPSIIPNDPAASRCMSLLLFAVFLWVTEAIPYFATAMLIPILVPVLGVLKDPKDLTKLMTTEEAATFVTDHVFNHTTFLLLGGYTLSTAFSRCQLELRVASLLQNKLGSNPKYFILAIMFLGLFLSMWISNHTAPILCATIILPIVRDLPTDSR
jgi:phosphate transporter